MLWRWTDFDRTLSMMDELQRRMNRLVDEYEGVRSPEQGVAMTGSWPPINLYDAGEELVVEAMVPGLRESDLTVTCNQGVMTIAGERKTELPKGYTVHRRERGEVRFSRSFTFPCAVDLEKVSALVKDGILTVTVAKAPEAKPRQITVKAR